MTVDITYELTTQNRKGKSLHAKQFAFSSVFPPIFVAFNGHDRIYQLLLSRCLSFPQAMIVAYNFWHILYQK